MTIPGKRRDTILLLMTVATLLAGVAFATADLDRYAQQSWQAGAILMLGVLVIEIAAAVARKEVGLDVLALLSIGGALALGEALTAAVIALMLASGRALESYAEARAQRDMSELLKKVPRTANRYDNGLPVAVPLESVKVDDMLLVRSGESVPVDGRLVSPTAVLDEAALTGESLPVTYTAGKLLQSGAVNAGAAFDMRATQTAENSTFAAIIQLVKSAQQSKAPSARLADRYALLFVPFSLIIAGVAWLATGDPLRALAVIVVATPCPLLLAVPVAIVCGMSRCAQRGVLIKHGGALEKLAQANALFLDKTGTLTGGQARLVAVVTHPASSPEQILQLAASLDQISSHSIAQAVVQAARERSLALLMPQDVIETPGAGLHGTVKGKTIRLGGYDYVGGTQARPEWLAGFHQRVGYEGGADVYLSIEGELRGALQFADEIRMETPHALRMLRAAGIGRIVMLTGDRQAIAETIGRALEVDQILARQSPQEKLAAISSSREHGITVMIGDGVNDAPALMAADVGIAMGARGAAAAAEAAQIVLLVDRLDRLAFALRIAQGTRRIALQSVMAGMGLSILAMLVAAFGYLPPLAGAVVQECIDVAVILNALRVLRLERRSPGEGLSPDEIASLRSEHAEFAPLFDHLGRLAHQLPDMPTDQLRAETTRINVLVQEKLLPHESQDDRELYPRIARLMGGQDPLGSMSRTHREIQQLGRSLDHLQHIVADSPDGVDRQTRQELQDTLYALKFILQLHFAQEEEIYHNLA